MPFDLPRQCCLACWFPWCVAARQRLQLLGPAGEYVPCEGILCCDQPRSRCWLFFEVLLCLDVAITGNRRILQRKQGLLAGRFDSVCCMMPPGADPLCRCGRGDVGDLMACIDCCTIGVACTGYYLTLVRTMCTRRQMLSALRGHAHSFSLPFACVFAAMPTSAAAATVGIEAPGHASRTCLADHAVGADAVEASSFVFFSCFVAVLLCGAHAPPPSSQPLRPPSCSFLAQAPSHGCRLFFQTPLSIDVEIVSQHCYLKLKRQTMHVCDEFRSDSITNSCTARRCDRASCLHPRRRRLRPWPRVAARASCDHLPQLRKEVAAWLPRQGRIHTAPGWRPR